MDTSGTRVTREQAAALVGVHPRTINRWTAAGKLHPEYDPKFRGAATYSREEVLRAAGRSPGDLPETG